MKKVNVKVTVFLCAIALAVVVFLLNFIEFSKTVDFTVPGIRIPKENAYGRQEEVQVSVSGTYSYRVLPWITGSSFHGQISYTGEGEEPQNDYFLYGGNRGFRQDGIGFGWIGPLDADTTTAIYEAVQNVEKGMISIAGDGEDPGSYILYPAATLEEAYAIADVKYPGMLENNAKTASCAVFLPKDRPQKIGCSFCTEDYDYVEETDTVEALWQEFVQLSGEVTTESIPPEEMAEGVGYFQFVYGDGEARTFRYTTEEQGLWIDGEERCLVDGKAFYDWQEHLMEAVSGVTEEDFADTTIHNREEFADIFSLETIETMRSFAWDEAGYELVQAENNQAHVYEVFRALLEGDTLEEYTKYTDPVTSAVALLHLGEGSGMVTETLYKAKQQFNFSDNLGEGSVVNVRYTFAADDSFIDIPMVMAEETQHLWFLSCGTIGSAADRDYGALDGDVCTRSAYREYEFVDGGKLSRLAEAGSYTGEEYTGDAMRIQISSFGIYLMKEKDSSFQCIHPEWIPAKTPMDMKWMPEAYPTSEAYEAYQADQKLPEGSGIRVFYLTDPEEDHRGTDAWMPTVLREYDLGTGETVDRTLPENLQIGNGLWVQEGYYNIENSSNPAIRIQLPLVSTNSLYAGKSWEQLAGAVDGSYAASRGTDILAYPGVIFDVSERTEEETFALLDLDGDGLSEKISLHPAEPVQGYSLEEYTTYVNMGLGEMNCYDLREAVLEVNGRATEIHGENMSNSIFAFSPDGKHILIVLYDDGASADPLTRIYYYENGKLVESGQIEQDLRQCRIGADGQFRVREPYTVVQTDSIWRIYKLNALLKLEEIPQDSYELSGWAKVEVLQDMTLYRTPGGETFELPAGSYVCMTKLDATQSWICLRDTDGVEGWFKPQADVNYDEYFKGLNRAG